MRPEKVSKSCFLKWQHVCKIELIQRRVPNFKLNRDSSPAIFQLHKAGVKAADRWAPRGWGSAGEYP